MLARSSFDIDGGSFIGDVTRRALGSVRLPSCLSYLPTYLPDEVPPE